uniref:CA domain-containing protein n=1 Tax=Macrostomum lignano TaxID=282301 RepID=A0A1I8FBM3_9PLAT
SSSASPTRQAATGASATAIEPRTAESSCFRLDPSAGLLSLEFQKLDREANPLHRIVIRCQGLRGPPLSASVTATLSLMDVNDNRPSSSSPARRSTCPEAVPVGHVITRLRATSRDTGRNAEIRYRLLDSAGLFNLSELTSFNRVPGQEGLTGVSSGSSRPASFTACAGRDVNLAASALPRSQLVIPELRVIAAVPGNYLLSRPVDTGRLGEGRLPRTAREKTSPSSPQLPVSSSVSCAALLGRSSKSSSTCQRAAGSHFSGPRRRLFVSERTAAFDAGESAGGWREVAALKVFFGREREMLARRRSRLGEVARVAVADGRPNKGDKVEECRGEQKGQASWSCRRSWTSSDQQRGHHATVGPSDLSADSPLSSTARRVHASLPENAEPGTACGRQPDRTADSAGDNRRRWRVQHRQLFSLDMSIGRLFARKKADARPRTPTALDSAGHGTDYGRTAMTARRGSNPAVLDENDLRAKFDPEEYVIRADAEMGTSGLSRGGLLDPVDLKPPPNPPQIDDKGNVSQQPYLVSLIVTPMHFRKNAGSDGGPASGRLGLCTSATARRAARTAVPFSCVAAGGRRVATAGQFLRGSSVADFAVNINFGHCCESEEQDIIVQACRRGQRTLCGRAKLFVRTVRADQLTPSLLPSNLTAVLAYPAAGGEKLGRLRLRHPSPKDARLRLLSHSDLFSLAPNGELSVAMATTPPDGLHRVREVRVRVTLLTEAMAESAVPLHLGGGSAHGFFLDRRDAQLAEQLTAQLRLGADARVLLLGVQRGSGGGERQRQLMALLAVYEESRRGFLDPAEVRSRLNSSEAVRSRCCPRRRGLQLGGGGSAGPAAAGGDGRDHLHGAGVPAGADMRHALSAPPSGAVFGFFPGGSEGGEGAAWALADRGRGASCAVSGCGGWRLALRLHADGDGRLEPRPRCPEAAGHRRPRRSGAAAARQPRRRGERRSLARVLLRLHDGSPYWTLELLTDSIEPQLGQLPALPASSPSSWDRASTLRVELDRFVGCLTDLLSWPAATRLTAQRRLRLRPRLGAAARRPSWRRPARRRRCQHEGVCTEVGAASRPTPRARCELNLRPLRPPALPERRRLPGLRRRARRGFRLRLPGWARPDRAASWWTAAAAERRPHLVEVEAPANTAAGAWAAAAAARAPAMLGALCDPRTSTSADRPSGCAMAGRRLRQPAGPFRCGSVRVSIGFHRTGLRAAARPTGAAIDGGASASEQPLLLGLRFHELAAVLGCVSSLLLLALAVFCLVSCYGKRRRGRRRRGNHGNGRVAKQHSPASMSPPTEAAAAAAARDDPGEEAMALMPMMAPPMIKRQLRRPGGLADVRRLRDAAAAAANAAVNADRQLRGLRALPVLLRLLRLGRRRPMSTLRDTSDWRGLAATLGGLARVQGPRANPPDLIHGRGPFTSVSYFGRRRCRQTSASVRHRRLSNAVDVPPPTSGGRLGASLVVIAAAAAVGGSGFGGFGGPGSGGEEAAACGRERKRWLERAVLSV